MFGVLGALKIGLNFIGQYRIWFLIGAAVTGLTSILFFYGNARANAVELIAANELIRSLQYELSTARIELNARNQRIRDLNIRQLEELRRARDMLRESLRLADRLNAEKKELKLQLEENRFELLETIRDDEEMADWVDYSVPTAAWGLLQQASQGTTRSRVRADH